jgi:hypothetical protein
MSRPAAAAVGFDLATAPGNALHALCLQHDRAPHRDLSLVDSHFSSAGTATLGQPFYPRAGHTHAAGTGMISRPLRADLYQFAAAVSVSQEHFQYLYARDLHRIEHQRQMRALGSESTTFPQSSGLGIATVPKSCTASSTSTSEFLTADSPSSRLLGWAASAGPRTLTAPSRMSVVFADPTDSLILSPFQALLRQQIELFAATEDDLLCRIRGRNKGIELGQVGIRCRHCAHVFAAHRAKGSVYFPATLLGLYQAAQNMSSNHIQCGLCPEMPQSLKDKFTEIFPTKVQSSGVGRAYWAESAKQLGMIDTDHGIRFVGDI